MSSNILVTICARGGSKGVKNKNIRPLLGKPLIAHTIAQAKRWPRASKIVVSTDSNEIASAARDFGAEIPFMRPAELASDTADKLPVIRHALIESEKIFRETFDAVVDLDVTSPIRKPDDLEKCFQIFERDNADVVFSVVPAHKNPYFNMVELGAGGSPHLVKRPDAPVGRRQDAPVVYDMNASIYFFRKNFLLQDRPNLFSEKSRVHVMDELSSFDIDREIDFQFVEFLVEKGHVQL